MNPDDRPRVDQGPEDEERRDGRDRRRIFSRRRHDQELVKSNASLVKLLGSISAAQFVVIVVMGWSQLHTISELDRQNDRFTTGVCTQVATLRSAARREHRLAKTDTPGRRRAHSKSYHELKGTLAFIEPLVDCKSFTLPPPA